MRVDSERYVLIKNDNNKSLFLTPTEGLSKDVCKALMLISQSIAEDIKDHCLKEYDMILDIVPLKITYEWQ